MYFIYSFVFIYPTCKNLLKFGAIYAHGVILLVCYWTSFFCRGVWRNWQDEKKNFTLVNDENCNQVYQGSGVNQTHYISQNTLQFHSVYSYQFHIIQLHSSLYCMAYPLYSNFSATLSRKFATFLKKLVVQSPAKAHIQFTALQYALHSVWFTVNFIRFTQFVVLVLFNSWLTLFYYFAPQALSSTTNFAEKKFSSSLSSYSQLLHGKLDQKHTLLHSP